MAGVERLQSLLEQCRKSLSSGETASLVDASMTLLKDNNFKVCQGALQALGSAAAVAGEHLKLHFGALLPAIVERLGDSKQPVRDAGRRLLLALMEVCNCSHLAQTLQFGGHFGVTFVDVFTHGVFGSSRVLDCASELFFRAAFPQLSTY